MFNWIILKRGMPFYRIGKKKGVRFLKNCRQFKSYLYEYNLCLSTYIVVLHENFEVWC